jgi:hypothetical protein
MVVLNGATTITEVEHFWGPAATPGVSNQAPAGSTAGSLLEAANEPANAPSLVVPVPVEPAAADGARPQFVAPPVRPSQPATINMPPVPDLASPPLIGRTASVVPPPIRVESAPAPPAPAPSAGGNSAAKLASSSADRLQTVAPPVTSAPAVPVSGRVIWIGRLQKNQELTITGKNCSTGTLIGELPHRPFRFSVSPGDLSSDGIVLYTSNLQYANNVVEPPGTGNGWNQTVYTWNPKYANDVLVSEPPARQNGWNRLAVRSRNPKISVIVIDWTAVN